MTTPAPTIRDCAHDATLLLGLLEAIGHLDNEGHTNAMTAVIESALVDAKALANNLDKLGMQK